MGISRRTFIKTGFVGAASLGIGGIAGCATPASPDASGQQSSSDSPSGIFEGASVGVGGELVSSVELNAGKFASIEKTLFNETDGLGLPAWDRITSEMIQNQAFGVDAISGATLSSMAIKNSIQEALTEAEAKELIASSYEHTEDPQSDTEADVVVIGSGTAGLFAALCAASEGRKVIVLEKLGLVGGTSTRSDGAMGPTGSARDNNNADALFEKIASLGLDVEGAPNFLLPVAKEYNTTYSFILNLQEKLMDFDSTIFLNTPCNDLVIENGRVVGVKAQPLGQGEFTITAPAVILATGGWIRNKEMTEKYLPQYAMLTPCNTVGATGDAYGLIKGLDVSTSFMDSDAHFYPIGTNGKGAFRSGTNPLCVDSNGDLFADPEIWDMLMYYSEVARAASLIDPSATYYVILTEEEAEQAREEVDGQIRADAMVVFDTLDEAKDEYGLTGLLESAKEYKISAEAGPFYVAAWKPSPYSTYGGLDLDGGARVLLADKKSVPGLYAAGEVAGSEAYRENGAYYGQLFPGLTMGMLAADSIVKDFA